MKYAINNIQLNVREAGSGSPTLVFMHYFGGSLLEWQTVIDQLSRKYRCIALDLRGHGDSDAPATGYSVDDMAADLADLIDVLAVQEFILIGHSMSGKVALALAAGSPDRHQLAGLRSLILLSPSPPLPEPISDQDRQDLLTTHGQLSAAEQTVEKITARSVSEAIKGQIIADNLRTAPTAWDAWLTAGSKESIADRMNRISMPVAIIVGSADKAIAPDVQKTMTLPYLKNVTFDIIQGTGHLLPLEVPDIIVDFIQKKITEH